MFYVLFTYSKGRKERDFRKFRSEDDLINFLHANYESIDIVQILGSERVYRLGLIETDEVAKSALIRQEIEADLPDPGETKEEEIMRENKAALKRADKAIKAAKTDIKKTGQKFDKSKWEDCPICYKEKVAPWSKKGICSICQRDKKKPKKK